MASEKNLNLKKEIVNEITEKFKNSESVVLFSYQGLTVSDLSELRKNLKDADGEIKVYKNTLAKRALDSLNYDMQGELNGPKARAYGKDAISPIKTLAKFAKEHEALEIKVGIVDGEFADTAMLNKLALVPSRDELLTMFAAGMLEHVKNVAIALDLHAKNLEEQN